MHNGKNKIFSSVDPNPDRKSLAPFKKCNEIVTNMIFQIVNTSSTNTGNVTKNANVM